MGLLPLHIIDGTILPLVEISTRSMKCVHKI